jgi:hypothetical protein
MLFTILQNQFMLGKLIESEDTDDFQVIKEQLKEAISIQNYLLSRGSNDESVNDMVRILQYKLINQ